MTLCRSRAHTTARPPHARLFSHDFHSTLAMTIIDYEAGTLKDMGKASAKVVTMGDKTSMKITLEPGFDWIKEVSPKLPGCPVWCPANHFGYLEKGTMKVKYEDGSDITVNAGESYNIPPGHLPEVIGDVPWCADIFPSPSSSPLSTRPSRRTSNARRGPALTTRTPVVLPLNQRHGRVLAVHRRGRGFHEEVKRNAVRGRRAATSPDLFLFLDDTPRQNAVRRR